MDHFRKAIIDFLKKETELEEISLEVPPNPQMGDFAFPCFSLSKELKKSPVEIAKAIASKFHANEHIEKAVQIGPYVNFFLNKSKAADETIHNVLKEKDSYGSSHEGKGKHIVLEHTSINPNASPHVGRARNAIIGDAIARILRFQGYKLEVHYLVNDVGKQIAMLVYGSEHRRDVTFDGLLDLYIDINKKVEENPALEKNVLELLNKLEAHDKDVRNRFEKIVKTCVDGQQKIFSDLGIEYDYFDYESEFLWNKKTDEALKMLEKTGKLFIDKDDRWVLDQQGYGLGMESPVLVLTRADKTSLYPLRDIAYNLDKAKKGDNVVVLGEDQKLYQEQICAALKELKTKHPRTVHYSFVLLSEGKMSTRKGNVVLLEDFMKEAVEKAKKEITKRYSERKDNLNEKAAKSIAYGAVKYSILRVSPEKNVTFSLDSALSFEGETSPYIQYAYARIQSILEKSGHDSSKFHLELLKEKEESELVKAIAAFPEIISKASAELRPHLIAGYVYSLAQKFNEYYHAHQILKAEEKTKNARIALIKSVAQVLKTGLGLLGIEVLEKM
jgi:arginyl-tRNA synthetase